MALAISFIAKHRPVPQYVEMPLVTDSAPTIVNQRKRTRSRDRRRLRNIFRRKKQKVEMSIQTEPWIEKLEEVQELQAVVESSRRHVDELNKNSREERAIALDQMKGLEAKLKQVMEELAQMKIDYEHTAEVLFEITNERDDLEIVRQNEKEEFNEKLTKQIDELEMVCQGKLELESKLVNLRRDQDEMIVKLKFYEDKIEQRTKELSALAEENTKLNEGMAQQKQELERLGDDEEIKRWQEELEKVHERNKELTELDAVLEQNKELVVETTVQKDVLKELSRVKEELEKTVVKQKKELDENDVQKKTFEEMLEENKKLETENAEQKLQLQELDKERTQRKELEDTLVMQKKGLDEALTLKQEEFDAFVKQNKRVEQENEQQKKQFYDAMAQSMDELTTAVLQREELGETNLKQREEFDEIIAERTEELEALVMRNEDLVHKNAQQKQEIALLVKEKETFGQDVIKLRRKFEERIYQQKRELDRASRYRKDLEAGIKQREKDAYMLQKDLENDLGIEIKRVKELTDSIDEAKEGWERDKNQLAQAQSDLEHVSRALDVALL
ncbi:cingulin-like [Lineus longissimus]|uniref:cingulin-like n=1 Tax=Lineus longissimus TaxID=88925 RepID=UPI00315D0AE4